MNIPLGGRTTPLRGHFVVDEADGDLAAFLWYRNANGYATRDVDRRKGRGVRVCIFAHRVVLERKIGRVILPEERADHINNNPLDCRRENLRITTPLGNMQNRKGPTKRNKSGFRGVAFHRQTRKWGVYVGYRGRSIYGGLYPTPEIAAHAATMLRKSLGFLDGTPPSR